MHCRSRAIAVDADVDGNVPSQVTAGAARPEARPLNNAADPAAAASGLALVEPALGGGHELWSAHRGWFGLQGTLWTVGGDPAQSFEAESDQFVFDDVAHEFGVIHFKAEPTVRPDL